MLLKKDIDEFEFIEVMQAIGLADSSQDYKYCNAIKRDRLQFSLGVLYSYYDLPKTLVGLELLFKGLIICERDFDWCSGSVASNIKIMQIIRRRSKSLVALRNLDKLIKWTFINKGRNPYTPFGGRKYSNIGSLSELKGIEETDRRIAKNHHELEKMQMEARIKMQLMEKEFMLNMRLKDGERQVIKDKEKYKEDRKDERTRIQATQQSEMIDQRNNQKPAKNFETPSDNSWFSGNALFPKSEVVTGI